MVRTEFCSERLRRVSPSTIWSWKRRKDEDREDDDDERADQAQPPLDGNLGLPELTHHQSTGLLVSRRTSRLRRASLSVNRSTSPRRGTTSMGRHGAVHSGANQEITSLAEGNRRHTKEEPGDPEDTRCVEDRDGERRRPPGAGPA